VSDSSTAADGTVEGRFVVVPASYVLLLRDGATGAEVLLQLRQGVDYMDGHWASGAAGHVERGETAYDAAHREAREELGVEGLDLVHVTTMQRTAHDLPIDERVDFFFTSRIWSGEPRVTEPTKSGGLRWVALDDLDSLPGPVVPHERVVLDGLRRGSIGAYSTFGFAGGGAGRKGATRDDAREHHST
jgi:8-oxo-dGTP diphosphatase